MGMNPKDLLQQVRSLRSDISHVTSLLQPPSSMCPLDGKCPYINSEVHQAAFRHTCTFHPCLYRAIVGHDGRFWHPPAVVVPAPRVAPRPALLTPTDITPSPITRPLPVTPPPPPILFCPNTGVRLICEKCDAPFRVGSTFCSKCGAHRLTQSRCQQ